MENKKSGEQLTSKRVKNKRVSISWDEEKELYLSKVKIEFLQKGTDLHISELLWETLKFYVEQKKLIKNEP